MQSSKTCKVVLADVGDMQTIARSLFPHGLCFDAASMDQGSARNQASKPEVDDLSTYSAHLVAFATETLLFLQPSNRHGYYDIGAIDGLSFKVAHHAEHRQRGWPTSFSAGG